MKLPIIGLLIEIARQLMPNTADWLKRHRWLSTLLFLLSLGTAIALLFVGCSTLPPETPNPNALYAHDLKVQVNGQMIVGFGVVPLAEQYEIKIFPKGEIDRIIIRTCHRELVFDKPDQSFWDRLRRETSFTTTLERTRDIEDVAACAMEVDVFEEKKKRSGFAVIDFHDRRPEISLPFSAHCNGTMNAFGAGVGVCQSAVGLVQEVLFAEPVLAESSDCPTMFDGDSQPKQIWRYLMPAGKCTAYFAARTKHPNGMRLKARLNTIGYSHVPPVN